MKNILITFILIILSQACQHSTDKAANKKDNDAIHAQHLEKGSEIAAATFTTLSTQIQKAMKEGGVPNALEYCNVNAYPITDSLSNQHNAIIKRTSKKVRNQKNKPNQIETEALDGFENDITNKKVITPYIQEHKDDFYFFAPIIINDLCLKCHGDAGGDISSDDYAQILKYYPEDQAVDYKSGDLRGIWSIRFTR